MVTMERDAHVGGGRRTAEGERLMEFEAKVGVRMQGLVISATTSFIYFLTLCVVIFICIPHRTHFFFFLSFCI